MRKHKTDQNIRKEKQNKKQKEKKQLLKNSKNDKKRLPKLIWFFSSAKAALLVSMLPIVSVNESEINFFDVMEVASCDQRPLFVGCWVIWALHIHPVVTCNKSLFFYLDFKGRESRVPTPYQWISGVGEQYAQWRQNPILVWENGLVVRLQQ